MLYTKNTLTPSHKGLRKTINHPDLDTSQYSKSKKTHRKMHLLRQTTLFLTRTLPCVLGARKGYFHSTRLMQARRMGLLSLRQKRARAARVLAVLPCFLLLAYCCRLRWAREPTGAVGGAAGAAAEAGTGGAAAAGGAGVAAGAGAAGVVAEAEAGAAAGAAGADSLMAGRA